MYSVGSLFSGIGGICLGFKKAGFRLDWANEIDPNACKTYKLNFSHKLIEGDIKKVKETQLSYVDILTSGFPCQAFSIAGNQKGFDDDRGNIFFENIRIAKYLRPKVLFLENVRNLKSHNNGNTFSIIKDSIEKIGYSFYSFILNTSEYGNIPQNRERIYIVCFDKENLKLDYINKLSENEILNSLKPQKKKLTKSISELLEQDKQDEKYYYEKSKYYPMMENMIKNKNTVYQLRRVYIRENKNNLCPTLTANMGTGGHNVPLIKDNFGIRKLTPRECLLFQGFGNDFKLPNIGNSHIYKQAGNSVSVSVIEKIAFNIRELLKKNDNEKILEPINKKQILEIV